MNNVCLKISQNNIIYNSFICKISFRIFSVINKCNNVHIGDYQINNNENLLQIFNKICNGNSIFYKITFPEGLETREIIDIIKTNKHLSGEINISFEEGMFLPETYSFKSETNRNVLLKKMNDDLNSFINNEWENRDRNIFIKSKKEAIILASIIEKEAKTDGEKYIISGVFMNRLKKNYPLESCPTVFYEITNGKYKLKRPLTNKDTKIKGNYNTYQKVGLPIAPICNPGKQSILSALHPKKTDYMFFVAKNDLSGHIFSKTYKEHLKNIKLLHQSKMVNK